MTDHRRARAEMLARELNIDADDLPKLLDQYAATATQAADSDATGYLQTFPTFENACTELGDGVLEGYLPAGVYDLDTGELIELHVSTPIVTRSEDQGIVRNPLATPHAPERESTDPEGKLIRDEKAYTRLAPVRRLCML